MGILEVCCDGFEAALRAWRGGADRIELCAALELGGLTPTLTTLRQIKASCPGLKVMAMLRNRAGGFCYSETEYQTLLGDATLLLEAGADGLVFGFLREDGALDTARIALLTRLAHKVGREAALHRAFDQVPDPLAALQMLIALGVDRVLTSGQAATALAGVREIQAYQASYGDSIQILAGVGVNAQNATQILELTGVSQLHASCKTFFEDPTSCGKVDYSVRRQPTPCSLQTVDEAEVRRLAELLHRA